MIIGGGVGGTSIAYHLAKLGWDDVVLLERAELTSGSTFHSAGLVGQLRGSVSLTKMMMHSVELYRGLADESEFDPGWVECGGIRLASSEERMEELRRQAGWAKTFGLPLELISAEEAKEMFPLMSTEGVLGGAWLPTDGYIDPSQLTYALADVARREGGLQVFQNTRVTGDRGRATAACAAVETEKGADRGRGGGQRRRHVRGRDRPPGRRARAGDPDVGHQYLVTQPVREHAADRRLPTLRDPDLLVYYREDGGGLVMGGYERDSAAGLPARRAGRLRRDPARLQRPPARGRLGPVRGDHRELEEPGAGRWTRSQITKLINGPEAFTPDNEFCLGESEVRGFFVAAGFCAHGLAGAGGIGKVMAEWIAEGEPSLDLWEMDVRRFGAQYRSPAYTHARIRETYETYYDIRYPNHERQAGRPLRLTSANAWHAEHGRGVRREVGLGAGQLVRVERSRRRRIAASPRLGGTALVARDRRRASRHARGGGDLRRVLVREDGDRRPWCGGAARAPLRQRGGARRRQDHLHPDAQPAAAGSNATSPSPASARSCFRSSPAPLSAITIASGSESICPTTARRACATSPQPGRASGSGGRALATCSRQLTPADLSNESFAYMNVREITVGAVPVRALRVTYVGELGWELYCPTEYGLGLWRALWEAGQEHGIVAAGYRAIDSMRLEKGYRVWGADITPDQTPYEGGVGFCVKLEKDGGFIGREALIEAKEAGPRTRIACLTLADPRSVALGNEPVRAGGEIVGRVTTGGYGYTVERSIAYAYLPPELAKAETEVEVEIFGEWVGAEVAAEPLFDPKGERIRA